MSREFATTWWSQKWIDALDAMGWSNRLERGQRYARSGRVLPILVLDGVAVARVQGRRSLPYQVRIKVKPLTDAQWEEVVERMASRLDWASELLAGQMPATIEEAFAGAGARLLPASSQELTQSCSCPDWANPCKHVAAVHYELAESLDEEPFLMFSLRGMSSGRLLKALKQRWQVQESKARKKDPPMADPTPPTPLEETDFWGRGVPEEFDAGLNEPDPGPGVMRRLGTPIRRMDHDNWYDLTDRLYEAGRSLALSLASEDWKGQRPEDSSKGA